MAYITKNPIMDPIHFGIVYNLGSTLQGTCSKTRKNILRNFKSSWCETKKEKQNKCTQKRKVDEKKVGKEDKGKGKYMKRFIGNIFKLLKLNEVLHETIVFFYYKCMILFCFGEG